MDNTLTLKNGLALATPSTLLIICLIGLPQLCEAIFSPALPAVQLGFETTVQLVQWTMGVYFIGFALGSGFWGKMSDQIGRRPAILAGLLLFVCMSFACSNAATITYLLFARFFQAFGASVGLVVTHEIIQDCFTSSWRHKIQMTLAKVMAFTPVVGLYMGGYLSQHIAWQANFLCLTLMGILLLIYAGKALPETKQDILDDEPVEPPPSLMATIIRLLLDKHVFTATLILGGFNGILHSYYAAAPFLFKESFHLTAQHYGSMGVFLTAGLCMGTLLSQQMQQFIAFNKLIKFSCYTLFVALLIFIALLKLTFINGQSTQSIFSMMSLMMLFCFCLSFATPLVLHNALANYQYHIGIVSAIFCMAYYMWVAICIVGMSLIIPTTLLTMMLFFLGISAIMALSVSFLD